MEINIAKYAGFCTGVDKAYRTAIETAKKGNPVFVLGLLVHNHQVIQKLEEMGIKSVITLEEIPKIQKGTLIISAHGVGPKVYEDAQGTGLEIVDTTCPWVKKAQRLAKELFDGGYQVVIIGDKNHAEVKGIMGWTDDKAIVVEKSSDASQLGDYKKLGVVAQTTQSKENFDSIVEILKYKSEEIIVHNTICDATSKMQASAVETAIQADIMIVIGDKKSANTKRLKELCEQTGVETHQIQSAEELHKDWFKNKNKAGITAGASTPDWVIKEIVNELNE